MGSHKETYEFGPVIISFCVMMFVFCTVIYEFVKRISSVDELRGCPIGKKLSGVVVKVLDGDGFEFIHTPPLRTTVYLPGDKTLPVRLAGIDAPEMPGKIPGQPFAKEAKEYLTNLILRKQINIYIHAIDQYDRLLVFADFSKGFLCSTINVNQELVGKGFACVYTGRGAIYGSHHLYLLALEREAKRRKVGMWSLSDLTPMQHKRRYRTYESWQF